MKKLEWAFIAHNFSRRGAASIKVLIGTVCIGAYLMKN